MSKNNYPLVSIVVVVYKNDPFFLGLLSSIKNLDYPKSSLEIIVVSILSNRQKINSKDIPVKQIFINHRVGYSEAINAGIGESGGDYLFLPNPDTVVEKTALKRLLAHLVKNPDVGIVGPKIYSMDHPTKISLSDLPCTHFDQLTGKIYLVSIFELEKSTHPKQFYWLCGNAIVLRKSVWDNVQKYDETYFLYWEDADFSMKVRHLGYRSVMIPQAIVHHKGSGSIGITDDQVYYAVRNGRYFLTKYTKTAGRFMIHCANIFLLLSKSVQTLLGISDRKMSLAFIEGIIDFYKGRRGMRSLHNSRMG